MKALVMMLNFLLYNLSNLTVFKNMGNTAKEIYFRIQYAHCTAYMHTSMKATIKPSSPLMTTPIKT